MKKLLPFLLLIGVIAVFFRSFFLSNLLPIPSDTIVGLYNPFRDFYAKDFPRGVPFKNFLITDPVRQEYPWRFESILQEKIGQLPLWNPYNFAGTPLLANDQSAALYPFNLLFFVLPFSFSWSLLIFLQMILSGIFMYWYLCNLKVHSVASLFGSIAFIFSGFFVSWLEWGTVDNTLLWLPLLLLSIDKIYAGNKKITWYPIYFAALICSFLAGHLQTFFYVFVLAHLYLFFHWIRAKEKVSHIVWGIAFGLLALVLTSIQWLPLFQLIQLSGRNTDLAMTAGWFIPFEHLITFFVPDFFGNPTTLNYWGVWNYAELTGYIGIPAFLFAFFAVCQLLRNKRVLFFTAVTIVSFLFALPTPLGFLPLTLHVPFLSTAQPTRLLSLIDFSLAFLAAYGLDCFIRSKKKIVLPLMLFMLVYSSVWVSVVLHTKILPQVNLNNILVAKHNLVFPTSIFVATLFLVIVGMVLYTKKKVTIVVIVCLFFLSSFDSIRFADKFTPFTKSAYLFPQTKTLSFLQQHVGNSRIMTTDSQILPPNFSLMYHIESLDGYDPLYIKTYGQVIAAMERGKPDIHEPFGFNRIITPHNLTSPLINLLGVKYVVSLSDIQSPTFKKVFTEGQTQVYENTKVYPRAFFVAKVVRVSTQQNAINFLFTNNLEDNAVTLDGPMQSVSVGQVAILKYTDNTVVLQTQNIGEGFLVLSDVYYPTWQATIDGKKTQIFQTDGTLRGMMVPKGQHTIVFSDELF